MGDLITGTGAGLALGTCVTYPVLLWLVRNARGGKLPPHRRERRARAELDAFFAGAHHRGEPLAPPPVTPDVGGILGDR